MLLKSLVASVPEDYPKLPFEITVRLPIQLSFRAGLRESLDIERRKAYCCADSAKRRMKLVESFSSEGASFADFPKSIGDLVSAIRRAQVSFSGDRWDHTRSLRVRYIYRQLG